MSGQINVSLSWLGHRNFIKNWKTPPSMNWRKECEKHSPRRQMSLSPLGIVVNVCGKHVLWTSEWGIMKSRSIVARGGWSCVWIVSDLPEVLCLCGDGEGLRQKKWDGPFTRKVFIVWSEESCDVDLLLQALPIAGNTCGACPWRMCKTTWTMATPKSVELVRDSRESIEVSAMLLWTLVFASFLGSPHVFGIVGMRSHP